jgi:hypothetical protein
MFEYFPALIAVSVAKRWNVFESGSAMLLCSAGRRRKFRVRVRFRVKLRLGLVVGGYGTCLSTAIPHVTIRYVLKGDRVFVGIGGSNGAIATSF